MNNRQKFTTDALAGGWKVPEWLEDYTLEEHQIQSTYHEYMDYEVVLLDPLAWQAVGRTRGWEPYAPYDLTAGEQEYIGEWVERMHGFIDRLADGKTIEEALSTLI